jgi:phosphoadenosine phosphosulfate reductase
VLIYWCPNCNVPVLGEKNKSKLEYSKNNYIDIEDELLEYLNQNNLSERYYKIFQKLKTEIKSNLSNDESKNLLEDYHKKLEKIKNDYIKFIYRYAIKYLKNKIKENSDDNYDNYICPECGDECNYIGKDIKPVFSEEKLMIKTFLDLDLFNKSVWKTQSNRYIIDGEVKFIDLNKLYKSNKLEEKAELVNKKIDNKTLEDNFEKFIKVNKDHFNFIDENAMRFINNAKQIFNDRMNVISFSGGKDSTVVSDIVRRALGTKDILHVFGDTTLEFPTTYQYLNRIKSRPNHPPFLPVDKSEKDFMELSKKIGPPSRVMSWCCTIFKTGPIGNLFREIAQDQEIITYYGVRRSESSSRSKYDKVSKSPKISKQLVVSPIIDWKDADVWLYLLSRNIDFNEAYKFGFSRVGCWVCPNNSKWSEFLSKVFIKDKAKEWNQFLINFAKDIGKPDPEVYINSGKWKARQGGNGIENNEIQLDLEGDFCGSGDTSKSYSLTKAITEELYELFKPFGILNKEIGNSLLGEVIIFDPNNEKPLFSLKGKIGSKEIKVTILEEKNIKLKFQRIECQLRKFQTCIRCEACPNICPYDAISVKNGYKIDEEKCTNCKKCIAYFHNGCIVTKTMMKS